MAKGSNYYPEYGPARGIGNFQYSNSRDPVSLADEFMSNPGASGVGDMEREVPRANAEKDDLTAIEREMNSLAHSFDRDGLPSKYHKPVIDHNAYVDNPGDPALQRGRSRGR